MADSTTFAPRERTTWLGISLSPRDVGYAVTNGIQVLRFGVINLRTLHSSEAKQARFRRAIDALIDDVRCDGIAVVPPFEEVADRPVVRSYSIWLSDAATQRRLDLRPLRRWEVRRQLASTADAAPTRRGLARHLAAQFPELRHLVPAVDEPARGHLAPQPRPASPPPYLTSRERYWEPMFLALSAALVAPTVTTIEHPINPDQRSHE